MSKVSQQSVEGSALNYYSKIPYRKSTDKSVQLGEEARRRNVVRLVDDDGARILLAGDPLAEALAGIGVDGVGDPDGGREIGIAQLQDQVRLAGEARLDLALDDRAVRDAAGGRHALRQRLGLALRGEAGDEDRALRDRIDLAVGGLQRRHDQRAAVRARWRRRARRR